MGRIPWMISAELELQKVWSLLLIQKLPTSNCNLPSQPETVAGNQHTRSTNKFRQGDVVFSCYGSMTGQDCSGRGLCDYTTGACKCFPGYGGTACEIVSEIS